MDDKPKQDETLPLWWTNPSVSPPGEAPRQSTKNGRNRKIPHRLPTVAELFPEIVKPALDRDDDLPSCSAVEALERQEPFINQTLAFHALAMLARLFRHGRITHHGGFINLASGRLAPLPSKCGQLEC